MGKLLYGPAGSGIPIDDRPLAHLQVVMLAKLRRKEAFAFTWEREAVAGSGRTTIWVTPTMCLEFEFHSPRSIPSCPTRTAPPDSNSPQKHPRTKRTANSRGTRTLRPPTPRRSGIRPPAALRHVACEGMRSQYAQDDVSYRLMGHADTGSEDSTNHSRPRLPYALSCFCW
jgi:hypothetical protein